MKTQTSDTIDEIVSLIREEGKEFRKEWRHLDSKRKEYQSEGQDRIELYTQMQEMYEQLNLPHTIYIREGPGSPGSLYNLDITSNGENPLVVDPLNFSNFSVCTKRNGIYHEVALYGTVMGYQWENVRIDPKVVKCFDGLVLDGKLTKKSADKTAYKFIEILAREISNEIDGNLMAPLNKCRG
ncbi:hypothetical protein J4205_04230 [Candidatus Pacearchaeota archaeon]|nr:hypothetical protein [Candidatus Pacearchaeota archaeon]